MNHYIELVLKKEKKPVALERIINQIEKIKSEEAQKAIVLSDREKEEVLKELEDGVESYDIFKTPSNNYILMSKTSFRKGRFYGDRTGAGKVYISSNYIDRDGNLVVKESRVEVSRDNTNGAIDGDFVFMDLGGKTGAPKIIKVLDRTLDYIPGEVYSIGGQFFLKPADKKKQGIMIAIRGDAIEGQRVAVSLKEQTNDNFYIGEIVKVFNHKDDPNEDILWEAFKHGIDNEFSNESLEQLEHIPSKVRDIDKIGREDLTDWEIFTIDGADTKDIDDAISCKMNERGNYVLGVHIADVASIVPEGSPLDKDAFNKGNSYYLGGTVFPMFPHQISNGIGSLNPNVTRMTVSCIVEINPNGDVVSYHIAPSLIKSNIKMTYEKVNELLKEGKVPEDYQEHAETLRLMSKLALILRKKRLMTGAVEFDRAELKVVRDENGKVSGFDLRKQDVAEDLIEEFMLVANETVDKDLTRRGLPCVHRVHASPNESKIVEFLKFLEAINLPFNDADAEEISHDKGIYQKLVEHISKSGRLSDLLMTEAIKCMSRAKYSFANIGHYGLAKSNYCHFTSPIRRDSDLTVHRILWDCVFGNGNHQKMKQKWENRVPEVAEKTTHMEKVADEAERDILRMLCAEYMEEHIGEEYEGTIIYVSSDCLTIQLDNLIEGTVRLRDLKGDYVHSPETFALVSLDGEDNYFVGDRLRLKVKRASKENKIIDFSVVEKINETNINNSKEINNVVKIKAKNERTQRFNGTN